VSILIKRKLSELIKMVNGRINEEKYKSSEFEGVSIDTRTVKDGNLFIPIIGEKFNGHEFVDTAFENGAVATLWQEDQPNPPSGVALILVGDTLKALQTLAKAYRDELSSLKVVGITGSNGKTTTKDMVASVLATTYKVHKTEGNFNNHIGLPLTILRLEEETEIAVLEMGMSAKGEIELLSSIARPDAAIITNIGESHLQDLVSREGIAEAKLEIIAGLTKDGLLVYHGDEPLLTSRINERLKTKTFGTSKQCDYYPSNIQQKNDGTYFSVSHVETSFYIPVLGKHNVNNALASIALARYFDVTDENIAKGLAILKITGMRTEVIAGKRDIQIINDAYNASPTSMRAAIELLQDLKGDAQKIVVLGDMLELGENEESFHVEIGRILLPEKIDYVLTFGELGAFIAKGAKEHFPEERVLAFHDKSKLIKQLDEIVSANDIVLVKASRGMRLEEVVTALLQ